MKFFSIASFLFIMLCCATSNSANTKNVFAPCLEKCDAGFQSQIHTCNPEVVPQLAKELYDCMIRCKVLCEQHGGNIHTVDDTLRCVKIIEI
jgi:hypothetical protein